MPLRIPGLGERVLVRLSDFVGKQVVVPYQVFLFRGQFGEEAHVVGFKDLVPIGGTQQHLIPRDEEVAPAGLQQDVTHHLPSLVRLVAGVLRRRWLVVHQVAGGLLLPTHREG